MLTLCCTRDTETMRRIMPSASRQNVIAIGPDGHCNFTEGPDRDQTFYYSEIQNAGTIEPLTGRKGLGFLPNCIIYSSFVSRFSETFANYRETVGLHRFTALYFEVGACITYSGSEIWVSGEGSILLLRARPFDSEGRNFELLQYNPGEIIHMTMPEFAIKCSRFGSD